MRIAIFLMAIGLIIGVCAAPPRVEKMLVDGPDTSLYRCSSKGWTDLSIPSLSYHKVIRRDSDTVLTVRNAKTDSVEFAFYRPQGWLAGYAATPDRMMLVMASKDGDISIWDLMDGRIHQAFATHAYPVDCVHYVLASHDTPGVNFGTYGLCLESSHPIRQACLTVRKDYCVEDIPISVRDGCPPLNSFAPYETAPEPYPDNPQPAFDPYHAQVGGRVIVRVCVNEKGEVRDWIITKEDPKGLGFGDAVLAVIPKWRFKPAMQMDQPVAVWVAVPFTFNPKK